MVSNKLGLGIGIGAVATLGLLGLTLDRSLLFVALVALCPLMHLFGGHGHSSHHSKEEKT